MTEFDGGQEIEVSDAVLVSDALGDNPTAIGILFRRYHPQLVRLASARLGSTMQAEDIAHEAFVRSIENLARLLDASAYAAWLRRIAENLCIDELRARGRVTGRRAEDELRETSDASWWNHPDTSTEEREHASRLWEDFLSLSGRDRLLLWLRHEEDLSSAAIAPLVGRSPSTVRNLLREARLRLRSQVDETATEQRAADPDRSG